MATLTIRPLTAEAFRPFGDLIRLPEGAPLDPGKNQRIAGAGRTDFAGATPVIDVLYSAPRPLEIAMLERHRNSTQAFIPLVSVPFVIVVAAAALPPEQAVDPANLVAFISSGQTGINLHMGVWHHPLIPVGAPLVSAIVHRSPDIDLDGDVVELPAPVLLRL